jgi:hypothetical protein
LVFHLHLEEPAKPRNALRTPGTVLFTYTSLQRSPA